MENVASMSKHSEQYISKLKQSTELSKNKVTKFTELSSIYKKHEHLFEQACQF